MDLFTFERKQFPWYRSMRATQPVHYREQEECWEVFRYDDVLQVLSDHKTFSSGFRSGDTFTQPEAEKASTQPIASTMIALDPPRHDQLRGLVAHDFTPRTLARLTPRITQIASDLLDQVTPTGSMDVVRDFSYPLPVIVISEMLGLSPDERPRFKWWSDALLTGSFKERIQARERGLHGTAEEARKEMSGYFEEILEQRRRQPGDDLISKLIAARVDEQPLSQEELLGFCELLLIAGNITTTNLIPNAIICLDEHQAALERLRQAPQMLPRAIEEVLRYRSPVHFLGRRAATTTRLGSQEIQAGQTMLAWVASANRDETRFPEPERFDIERAPNHHLSFGYDIHFCLGAHLARLESKIGLAAMLERLPDMRRVPETPLEMVNSDLLYGVKNLSLTFTPSAATAREPVMPG